MKFAAAVCVISFLATPGALAAPVKKGGLVKPSPEKRLPYSATALDPSVDDLKPNYLGHDCRALAKKLTSLNPQKGEFETTAAYRERMDSLSNESIVGSVKPGDVVGFVPSSDMLSMFNERYDADSQSMDVSDYIADSRLMVGGQLVSSKKLVSTLTGRRTYEGSNAYGKKVSVTSSSYDTCAIAFSNMPYMSSPSANKLSASFTIPADEARIAKGNIAALYVGNLERPYRVEFSDYLKPTIDSPLEASWGGDALVMKLVQVWFFNKQTGKVYKKLAIP